MYTQARWGDAERTFVQAVNGDRECTIMPGSPALLQIVGEIGPFVDQAASGPAVAPDEPSLADWRIGLDLWKRLDVVVARVKALVEDGQPLGRVAQERLEYANTVRRDQLRQLAGAFGFTLDEVEESLWRADRVKHGDLSGIWPLPA